MLVKAINNNQFTTWPGLTAHATVKYLQDTPATDKGHMKRLRQKNTIKKVKTTDNTFCATVHNGTNPSKNNRKFNQVFCYSGYIDKKEGTIYVDLTGKFPI